jgi:hypothetical protein
MNKKGAPTKFSNDYIEVLKKYSDDPRPLATDGEISNQKVADILNVSKETVRLWRTPCSGAYIREFRLVLDKLQNKIYAGLIKRGLIERAIGGKQVRIIKEQQRPRLPALSKMSKQSKIDYGNTVLKLSLNRKMSETDIENAIREAADAQTELVITSTETTVLPADPTAAKIVLPNLQDKDADDNWQFKDEVEHNVTFSSLMLRAAKIMKDRKKTESENAVK